MEIEHTDIVVKYRFVGDQSAGFMKIRKSRRRVATISRSPGFVDVISGGTGENVMNLTFIPLFSQCTCA
jgi:hypothetical protein